MTGLAWVICLLLRLCPEVTNSSSERTFSNYRKWNQCKVAQTTNIHSSSFTADVNFEVRKDDKAYFYLMKSTTYQNKAEKIGNYEFLKV